MARIFFALALFATGLLIGNIVLGFWIGDFAGVSGELVATNRRLAEMERAGGVDRELLQVARQEKAAAARAFKPVSQRATLHKMLGIAAALVAVLVNSITVTYFIGTARWCREVVETYSLDDEFTERSAAIKRRTFPWALGAILTVIGIIALGAASDPAANFSGSADWVMPHYMAALIGTAFIGYALLQQVGNIGRNFEVIEEILAEVRAIREARGLDAAAQVRALEIAERGTGNAEQESRSEGQGSEGQGSESAESSQEPISRSSGD